MTDSCEQVIDGETLLRLPLSSPHEILAAGLHQLTDSFLVALNCPMHAHFADV